MLKHVQSVCSDSNDALIMFHLIKVCVPIYIIDLSDGNLENLTMSIIKSNERNAF